MFKINKPETAGATSLLINYNVNTFNATIFPHHITKISLSCVQAQSKNTQTFARWRIHSIPNVSLSIGHR